MVASHTDRRNLRQTATRLEGPAEAARELAEKLGLDGHPVKYWVVDYDEMNELIAYDGFQTRYPHWRWGMKYDRQRKESRYGGGKAFEIVINDDPAHAFLQESNTSADQKAVITHVEGHADFFKNNRWYRLFGETVDSAAMLERHARRIEGYMEDPDIDREEVEAFIDSILSIVDTIDQHRPFDPVPELDSSIETDDSEPFDELDLSDDIREAIFDEEWRAEQTENGEVDGPVRDLLAFLRVHGKQYDEEASRAVEMADWQRDILDMLRAEAYYFAPQKMTKVMNEGWAAYWESIMMGEEAFADSDEFIQYADHQSKVLGSGGLNPYKLGKEVWEYVENRTNRREVVERLLRVDHVTWRNFHEVVDFEQVQQLLEPPAPLDSITEDTLDDLAALDDELLDTAAIDRARSGELDVTDRPWAVLSHEGLARRHYSLCKPQYRGFIEAIGREALEQMDRYLFDDERYTSVEEALADVDYTAGWDRMFEVRESKNDVTFLDEFLTPEFIRDNEYFTYEYSHATGDFRVASTDPDDVKKKLLLQFTNFGKPTITVEDGNYNNRNELLLAHQYNGIALDIDQAARTLERVFDLWGRPVNLKTILKELDERDKEVAKRRGREPEPEEQGKLLRYDGESFEMRDLVWEEVEDIAADDIDYSTKPEDWLQ
ncbi:MAG: SpoVR family protein [Halobacteriales archaeon]